jgi:DNA polymerase I-like protein with 3'-5' exonuclease and polymerase domains
MQIGIYPETWDNEVGCDLETSGLDPYGDQILSLAIASGEEVYVYYWGVHDFSPLIPLFLNDKITKIWHNARFDLGFLKIKLGIDVVKNYDTLLAEAVTVGGKGWPLDLKNVLARRLGVLIEKETRDEFIGHPGFAAVPPTPEMLLYITTDVAQLAALRQSQIKDLVASHQVEVAKLEFEVIPAVVALETGGIAFDSVMWQDHATTYQRLIQEADQHMRSLLGEGFVLTLTCQEKGQPVERPYHLHPTENKKDQVINFGSTNQLKGMLKQAFNVTLSSTGEKILQEFVDKCALTGKNESGREFVEAVLAYRKWQKRLGYDYPKYLNSITGKIHPRFNSAGTDTGRFSCTGPNMQQVTRPAKDEPNDRQIFIADTPEHVIIRADYAQQEPRILGQLSGDPELIKACNTEDVYTHFARLMYDDPSITKKDERRQIAKMFVLATGYGSGIERLSIQSGLPSEKCAEIRNKIFETFPGIRNYIKSCDTKVQMYGFVSTILGRRRYIDREDKRAFTTSVNAPIQGTAADMFKLALINVHRGLTELNKAGKIQEARVWNIVHDEIEVHCHKDDVETVIELVKTEMETAGRVLCPDVAHIAEIEYGPTWDK